MKLEDNMLDEMSQLQKDEHYRAQPKEAPRGVKSIETGSRMVGAGGGGWGVSI